MTVGENIKRIRKERGLTQKQLGELCGINEVQVRRYEIEKAHPKIETIERIANALDVPINQIKENLAYREYLKTDPNMKSLDKKASAIEGIIAILTDIYGKVESKELEGKYASGHYYFVGEGKEQFALYDGDIDTLYRSTKAAMPALVERMKDSRPEKEIIQEYLKELNDKETHKQLLEKFKQQNK